MRITLTGASGFIGGQIARALVADGHELVALVRPSSDRTALQGVPVTWVHGDLSASASLLDACRGAEAVVHAAAVVRGHGTWDDFRPGVDGTARLLGAMAQAGVRKLVHLSSLAVYGMRPRATPLHEGLPLCDRPEAWNHYARQKVLSERLVWDAHAQGRIDPVVLRAAATLGPGDRASLPGIFAALRMGNMAVLGDGRNRVPFVVVEDLVRAVMEATLRPEVTGKAYNISGSKPITQTEFLTACAGALGIEPPTRRVPVGVAKLAAAAAEWLHRVRRRPEAPSMTRLGIAVATGDFVVDGSAAQHDLQWSGDRSYEDAIRREAAWLLATRARTATSLPSS